MTIGINNRQDYLGNGATATYSFNFLIFDDDDLLVTVRDTSNIETTLAKTTDYTVAGVNLDAGGSITLTAGNLTAGYTLTIRRVVPLVQSTDLRNQSSFFAEVLEASLDYGMQAIQQLNDSISRSVRLPETAAAINTQLPFPSAGQILMWAADGLSLINAAVPSGVTLVPGGISGGVANLVSRFTNATTLSSSSIFDNGSNTSIGKLAATDDIIRIRLQIEKNQNDVTAVLVKNANATSLVDTLAQARFVARSGNASNDISIGVTAASFTPSNGINSSAGLIYTGTDTVGLAIQTGKIGSSIYLQPGGSAIVGTFSPTGFRVDGTFTLVGNMITALTVRVDQNASTDLISQNATAGTAARATVRAVSDTGSIYMGVTSSLYTFIGSADKNQGFLATTDAGTVNGLVVKTVAGPMLFRPGHGNVAAPTNALMTLTTDYALELTDSSTAAVGALGTVRFRNNGGTLEISQNNGAYAGLGGGGGGLGGTGTANRVGKFSAGTTIANSTIFDDGTSTSIGTLAATDDPTHIRFQVQKDQADSTALLVRNDTSGALAQARITARSGSASLDISIGVTSDTFNPATYGVSASAGLIYTGTDTVGLAIQTGKPGTSIWLQPGGTGIVGQFSPTGLIVTGTLSLSGNIISAVTNRIDQNNVTAMLVQNANATALIDVAAQARFVARSGSGSNDISIGVTATSFTPANGINAAAGLIYTGTGATSGLAIQTGAGSIYIQPAGPGIVGQFSTSGLGITGVLVVSSSVTAASFAGNGASLTSLNAANLTGIVSIANGGTGVSTFTSGRLPYFNGSSLASSRISDNGVDANVLTGSLNITTSGQGIRFASTGGGVGSGIWGNSSGINISVGGTDMAAFDNSSGAAVTNLYVWHNGVRQQVTLGAVDSGGSGTRCLRVPN